MNHSLHHRLICFFASCFLLPSMIIAAQTNSGSPQVKDSAKKLTGDRAVRLESGASAKDALASDQLYYLRNSGLKDLPLTRLQQVKVNARLGNAQAPTDLLSPRQRKQWEKQTSESGGGKQIGPRDDSDQ